MARVRQLLDEWFDSYPEPHRADIGRRLRSPRLFDAAFFELFLYRLLRALGYSVALHPELDLSSGRRPDFLVDGQGQHFVLEATIATDKSMKRAGVDRAKAQLIDDINRLTSRDFMLDVRVNRVGVRQPAGQKIRAYLKQELTRLDPNRVADLWRNGYDKVPKLIYEDADTTIIFTPIPVKAERRVDGPRRIVGGISTGAVQVTTAEALRGAVVRKAGRYGRLDLPYIIAVNVAADFPPDTDDAVRALFGDERFVIHDAPDGSPVVETVRMSNGAWGSARRPKYRRVSAVLIGRHITPWSFASGTLWLVHNPWATHPCGPALSGLSQGILDKGHLIWHPGRTTSDLLGIPEGWFRE
jgi:hypothetical protein